MKYFLKIKGYNRRIETTYNIKGRTLKKLFRIVKNTPVFHPICEITHI